jgi:hypothetical protein
MGVNLGNGVSQWHDIPVGISYTLGSVGIGTDDPATYQAGTSGLVIKETYPSFALAKGGTHYWLVYYDSSDNLSFYSSVYGYVLELQESGNVIVKSGQIYATMGTMVLGTSGTSQNYYLTSGEFEPTNNNSRNLGSSGLQFATIYLGTSIIMRSPDNSQWEIKVSNLGVISATKL